VATPSSNSGNTFTDPRDNKVYRTVEIGTQVWMAQNLNYNASGSLCHSNEESNCATYGRLYNWDTALTACPAGWHLSSQGEWLVLKNLTSDNTTGKHLKATSGWNDYNGQTGNGLDTYGFTALPGGAEVGIFFAIGMDGYWWSSNGQGSSAYYFYIYNNSDFLEWSAITKNNYYSVRCLKDQ
jgi:uncharacterized protein (TIGR02145 family)